MDAKEVSQQAITETAEVVAEKIDVLLEQATDVVLGAPKPGSAQWRQMWEARDTADGRAALEQRARVKIAIAESAGVDLRHGLEQVHRTGVFTPPGAAVEHRAKRPQSRGRRNPAAGSSLPECQQLAIW